MIVIGLTGGIGMGKSTLTSQFAALGAKCINADDIVHILLAKGGAAVSPISKAFEGVVKNGAVDKPALRGIVFNNHEQRLKLESIVHPLVREAEEAFVHKVTRLGAKYAVLDIPLLFETGAQSMCDATVLASAPAFIQRQRVLARKGMTPEIFEKIRSAQMPEEEKFELADFVVPTSLGKAYSFACVKQILGSL